jgi:hypothetical protein
VSRRSTELIGSHAVGTAALAALISFSQWGCSATRKELVFSREELQAKLSGQFPLTKKKRPMKFRFSEPELLLAANSQRIGMRLAVEASVPGVTSFAGVMEADGELEYHPETGRFTIARGRLVDLELEGMPKQQMKLFEEMAQAVVTKQLSSLTVYQLDQEDFKQSLAKLVLKSVQVRDGAIIVEVGL